MGNTKKITIENLKSNSQTAKRLSADTSGLFYAKLIRPLSFYLAVIFLKINLSANQVTFMSFILGMIGIALFTTGETLYFTFALVFLFLAILFDYADGTMARFNNQATYYGSFLDGVVGIAIHSLLPISIGMGLYRQNTSGEILTISPIQFLILGSYLSLVIIFRECIRWRYYAQLADLNNRYNSNNSEPNNNFVDNKETKNYLKILNFIGEKISMIEKNLYPLILLLLITEHVEFYIIIHFSLVLLNTAFFTFKTIIRARNNLQRSRPL